MPQAKIKKLFPFLTYLLSKTQCKWSIAILQRSACSRIDVERQVPPQERVGDRDGSTATRSSSMTLKLVNGGVPATGREAVAELGGGVHIFVTLISPSACMWTCLLGTATGEN